MSGAAALAGRISSRKSHTAIMAGMAIRHSSTDMFYTQGQEPAEQIKINSHGTRLRQDSENSQIYDIA